MFNEFQHICCFWYQHAHAMQRMLIVDTVLEEVKVCSNLGKILCIAVSHAVITFRILSEERK